MVGGDDVIFAATGIAPGDFLDGVLMLPDQYAETHSLVMRTKTRTIH
jgi:fructose-1,6-bisphosphatase II